MSLLFFSPSPLLSHMPCISHYILDSEEFIQNGLFFHSYFHPRTKKNLHLEKEEIFTAIFGIKKRCSFFFIKLKTYRAFL